MKQIRAFVIPFIIAATIVPLKKAAAQQDTPPQIVQSPYYDAISLYYAFKNINAYPLPEGNSSTSSPTGQQDQSSGDSTFFTNQQFPHTTNNVGGTSNNRFPADSGEGTNARRNDNSSEPTKTYYTIIESSTGKILLDNVSGDSLEKKLNSDTFETIVERNTFINQILSRNAGTRESKYSSICKLYSDNKYLSAYFLGESNDEYPLYNSNDLTTRRKYDSIHGDINLFRNYNPSLPLTGGALPSVNLLANAYTDYLIDAVNAEADDAIFIRLENILTDSNNFPEFKVLFPKVVESFGKFEVTNYTQSLNTLKSSYQEDIKNILSNISKLATLNRYKTLLKKHPDLVSIFFACDFLDLIKKGTNAADILYRMSNADYTSAAVSSNITSSVKLAALISYCLRDIKTGDDNTDGRQWITRAKLNAFLGKNDFFKIFMGLMTQRAQGITFHDKDGKIIFDLENQLNENMPKIMEGKFIVYNFSATIQKLTDEISTAAGQFKNAPPTTISGYGNYYINIASQLLGLANNCLDILPGNKTMEARQVILEVQDTYIPIFTQANVVIQKIEAADYNAAVYEADTLIRQIALAAQASENGDGSKKTSKNLDDFQDNFLKYGNFIASIASAKSESDIKTLIKAFALPTGSSRIKKEHKFSLGLNSYVGYAYTFSDERSSAITAPLGMAFNWGLHSGKCGSVTGYLGLIDVGAIFTYKINNNDTTVTSSIQLGQLLSPSLGIFWGLPITGKKYNIPFSLGINSQWGPRLKGVTKSGNSVLPFLVQRWNIILAFDIPFLNFHVSKN